jgi:FPC/CPF motif-containing protein YcgG
MDLTSRAGRQTAEKIRKEIEALKGDVLLERKNAFGQLSPPPDDEREFRQFLGLALEKALRAEFGAEQ